MKTSLRHWCIQSVGEYLNLFPRGAASVQSLCELLATDLPLDDRRTLPGHLTASAIVLDFPRQRVLLIHHRFLNRWLQPGGHLEPGELPPQAARRELLEEVGIANAALISPIAGDHLPIDIDSHPIPANPARGEPAHTHHDFRFIFAVDSALPVSLQVDEVHTAEWVSFDDARVPPSIKRAIEKTQRVLHGPDAVAAALSAQA